MKRLVGILICALLFTGLQTFINCSSPLESDDIGNPAPPPPGGVDTLYITDSVFVTDTVFLDDTLFVTDTVAIIDTFTIVDTVLFSDTIMVTDTLVIVDTTYVEVPGVDCPFAVCSYISAYHKKIYWKFPDLNGHYEFTFSTDYGNKYSGGEDDDGHGYDCSDNCPLKKLKIHINNDVYFWNIGDDKTFMLDLNIDPNTVVKIFPYTSKWCKHKLDVCLDITPL